MKNGIVMEAGKRYYIVMTSDGEFLKVKKDKEHQVGEEISFSPHQEEKRSVGRILWVRKTPRFAFALVLLLIVIPFLMNFSTNSAYAYVALDINPSIEMSIDNMQTVTDIRAYNEDGKTIIRLLKHWKDKKLVDVMEDIIDRSEEHGYLKNERDVIISVTPLNKRSKMVDEQIDKTIHTVEQKRNLTVAVIQMNKRTHDEAKKLGVSPNKLAIAENKGVPVAEIKEKSAAEIKKMIEPSPDQNKQQLEQNKQQPDQNKQQSEQNKQHPKQNQQLQQNNKQQMEHNKKPMNEKKPEVEKNETKMQTEMEKKHNAKEVELPKFQQRQHSHNDHHEKTKRGIFDFESEKKYLQRGNREKEKRSRWPKEHSKIEKEDTKDCKGRNEKRQLKGEQDKREKRGERKETIEKRIENIRLPLLR